MNCLCLVRYRHPSLACGCAIPRPIPAPHKIPCRGWPGWGVGWNSMGRTDVRHARIRGSGPSWPYPPALHRNQTSCSRIRCNAARLRSPSVSAAIRLRNMPSRMPRSATAQLFGRPDVEDRFEDCAPRDDEVRPVVADTGQALAIRCAHPRKAARDIAHCLRGHDQAVDRAPVVLRQLEVEARQRRDRAAGAEQPDQFGASLCARECVRQIRRNCVRPCGASGHSGRAARPRFRPIHLPCR